MNLRPLLAIAAATALSACSPQALLAGLANNVAGPQIYENYMTTLKTSYASRGFTPAKVDCIMGKLRASLKPEDITNITLTPGGTTNNAQPSAKIAEAQKAAEAACP